MVRVATMVWALEPAPEFHQAWALSLAVVDRLSTSPSHVREDRPRHDHDHSRCPWLLSRPVHIVYQFALREGQEMSPPSLGDPSQASVPEARMDPST